MKKVQTNVRTKRPPEEVYAYLADFNNQAEWRFDVLESELVEGETGSVGALYQQRVKQGRREMEVKARLTQADAPRTVAFESVDSGPVEASGAWHVKPDGEGTHVVCDVAIEANGLMKLFEPMMGPSFRKTAERYERDLTERLA